MHKRRFTAISTGHVSRARLQRCIFCEGITDNAVLHVFGFCRRWGGVRGVVQAACEASKGQLQLSGFLAALLSASPDDSYFGEVLAWCEEVSKGCVAFWSRSHAVDVVDQDSQACASKKC